MSFGKYQFLSWTRRGISANINEVDTLGVTPGDAIERASIQVNVKINNDAPVSQSFIMLGPGDIVGIKQEMIIRTEPLSEISDFEPNLLPYIEFYDEDFPWRYTPASATGSGNLSLRPWIALFVLKEGEFEETQRQKPLPAIKVLKTETLPPHDELHLWAHTHTNLQFEQDALDQFVDSLEEDAKTDPDGLYSRILCPRKLEPNVMYHAFLVPAYETGRLAGLGISPQGVKAQQSSWPNAENEFPIYYRWNFRTGQNFDFEYLVKLLEPRVMDKRIGQRPVDCSRPGFVRADAPIEVPATDPLIIQLEGALKAPTAVPTLFPVNVNQPFLQELEKLVNLNQLQVENHEEDPYVTVPFYGMYHAIRKDPAAPGNRRIPKFDRTSTNWYNDLNRDPRSRIPAGFGVRVIQENQERLMAAAWKQLNKILEANKKMGYTQFLAKVSHSLFRKNVVSLPKETLLATTYSLSSRVPALQSNILRERAPNDPGTVKNTIRNSAIPDAVFKPEFRKITRNKSSLIKNLGSNINIEEGETPKFQFNALVSSINNAEGISAAPVINYAPLQVVSDISNFAAPLSIEEITVWSLQSNLELNFIYNVPSFQGGFPNISVWNTAFNDNIIQIIISGGTIPGDIGLPNIELPIGGGVVPGSTGLPGGITPRTSNFASREITNFAQAFADNNDRYAFSQPLSIFLGLDIDRSYSSIIDFITPAKAYKRLSDARVKWPSNTKFVPDEDFLPAMVYPDFPESTYKYLVDIDSELLLPNLGLIPPNTLSLLRTNQKFIESYLVGLNFEMGRELLWREYPTDMRGSYFRQFWDVKGFVTPNTAPADAEALKDIKPIDKWASNSLLGAHNARDAQGDAEQLVFVVRGDLLKKFPNTVIYAQKAEIKDGKKVIDENLDGDEFKKKVLFPLYQAELLPDIKLLGFDLTIEQAAGAVASPGFADADDPILSDGLRAGWFFIIAEVPGEPRFGMDITFNQNKPDELTWNDLSWENFAISVDFIRKVNTPVNTVNPAVQFPNGGARAAEGQWGRSAADMATILIQRPVMVAVHSREMLDNEILDVNAPDEQMITLRQHIKLALNL
ncbi:MAG: hypothetical protein SFU99_10335 [Saprospiraceae bacterium]|nr:hypothetical protein [Saprospiraceae bacterium]